MHAAHPTGSPSAGISPEGNARWLTRLRWAAIFGQTITILVASRVAGPVVRLGPLLAIVVIEVAFNVAVARLLRRDHRFRPGEIVAHLVFDLLSLTALLHFSGGPSNPFNFLYLVQIVLAAVLLGTRPALALAALSAILFGGLFVPGFLARSPDGGHRGHDAMAGNSPHDVMMRWHLEGMWIAFVIAAVLIVYFLGQILAELARKRVELERARERATRFERLSALTTLAAGAAHELATPLSTIAVISNELSRRFDREGLADADLREDTVLLRSEVRRCQAILQRMSIVAGGVRAGTAVPVRAGEVVDAVLRSLPAGRVRHAVSEAARAARVAPDGDGLRHALRAVVQNAIDASPPDGPVDVEVDVVGQEVEFRVSDRGPGIPEDRRALVTEPFYTTKAPGQGMGLGLFIADSVVAQSNGSLRLEGHPGGAGTVVRLRLPIHPSP
ncbi:MAG: ATP-binding protein [bacterium]